MPKFPWIIVIEYYPKKLNRFKKFRVYVTKPVSASILCHFNLTHLLNMLTEIPTKIQLWYILLAFWSVSLSISLTFSIGGCSPSLMMCAVGRMPGIMKPKATMTTIIATMITIATVKCQSFISFKRVKIHLQIYHMFKTASMET